MIKAIVIKKIVYENNQYTIGDRVRIKMKPRDGFSSELASEYIGYITDIHIDYVTIFNSYDKKDIFVNEIDIMRIAEPDETFENKFDF